jgi:hypothetical protein
MNTTQPQKKCPICNEDYLDKAPKLLERTNGNRYECRRCGTFDLDRVIEKSRIDHFDRVRHLISAWIRRQTDSGIFPVVVGKGMDLTRSDWALQFEHMGFPSTVNEKLDALLLAYADMAKDRPLKSLEYGQASLISEVAARNMAEVGDLTQFLHDLHYVNILTDIYLNLTVQGWLRISELRQSKSASDSAFIAMWFDACTEEYRKAAIAAAEYCGWKAVVVDQEEFNGFIMDTVVSLIRESQFVIADFTCSPEVDENESSKVQRGVRGGVYWEAGMAYGMNKPVIHTCKDSAEAKRRIHFDVDQYRTIFWQDDQLGTEIRDMSDSIQNPNFTEKLAAHILGTVGKGSYVPEKH